MARAKSGVRTGHQAYCKCGWSGATWLGPGSRGNAWGEYHWHRDRCPEHEPKIPKKWTRKRFFETADRAGLKIDTFEDGMKRIHRGSIVIIVWPDGACTRADVRSDLANKMTYREAAKALDLMES